MMRLILVATLLILACLPHVTPRICEVGYGQRGLKYRNSISWERNCKETDYCFEVVTSDIKQMKPLIDYPWDPYYSQFYIKGCGGSWGMQRNDYHPWRTIRGADEGKLGSVKVNLTFPRTITTEGGVQLFDLRYTCRQDLCSAALPSVRSGTFVLALAMSVALSRTLIVS